MLVTLKFYYRDPNLPSAPLAKGDPGLPYPVNVEIGGLPEKMSRIEYGGKKRRVVEVTTLCNQPEGEPVAVILVE